MTEYPSIDDIQDTLTMALDKERELLFAPYGYNAGESGYSEENNAELIHRYLNSWHPLNHDLTPLQLRVIRLLHCRGKSMVYVCRKLKIDEAQAEHADKTGRADVAAKILRFFIEIGRTEL